jgi:hypothetical protein
VNRNTAQGILFLALSYVWGKESQPLILKRENKDFLGVPGVLTAYDIPKTIEDAISLTKQLGFRYLWVDALCIIQDDENVKLNFLPKMGQIYTGAFITIIAAGGDSCHTDLPGLRPGTRTAKQEQILMPVKVDPPPNSDPEHTYLQRKLLLMTTLRLQQLGQDHYLEDAVWNKRC